MMNPGIQTIEFHIEHMQSPRDRMPVGSKPIEENAHRILSRVTSNLSMGLFLIYLGSS